MSQKDKHYILNVSCPDQIGVVSAVTGHLAGHACFVEESSDYGDPQTNRFFMRIRFRPTLAGFDADAFMDGFAPLRTRLGMQVDLFERTAKRRVVLMVSKLDHCLNDLLFRYRTGDIRMKIPAIISNHPDLRQLADWHDIPYHHIPVTPATKAEAEARIDAILEEAQADTIVLARYMQILSAGLAGKYHGRIINIHHSFLPGFKGARPYHRAHERGVKLIGATAHYVTADLDEGPIIEQQVERVEHFNSVNDMIAVGRDVECLTLARALRYHLEHRVFLNGNKTVVFRR
ncbi:formyltetrahydrofolate deformylase [Aquisalinus flavus]|uniref:Formyltetrahydrofolate deformylase n=1 Tax=Aquisalinus flavus TaxID=1526572 RepID=A0A8J2Y703_9PROT|nr:formyltetrahydrofolate deformylase [Aquisalinus flavus]MBD0426246.1 formyltetrahydrofolate deformylase [Aquisalinus flavus]UNE48182.1 formyltetrahydrofolate deformylase [Aquisalinus flavus]GGD09457.1 formyltetrahydrofolate deformylase [Aquisalinus flavus]